MMARGVHMVFAALVVTAVMAGTYTALPGTVGWALAIFILVCWVIVARVQFVRRSPVGR